MKEVLVLDNYFIPIGKDNLPYYQLKTEESEIEKAIEFRIKFGLSIVCKDLGVLFL